MDKIDGFIKHNPKYLGLKKPLEAARVCGIARDLADGHYDIISFKEGLLIVGVKSSSQSADIQMKSASIINKINNKLGDSLVKKIRYKMK